MSNAALKSDHLLFNDGSNDTVRCTATSQLLSFQGATNSHKVTLTNLDNPQNDSDASTKSYVDSQIASELSNKINGLSWKAPCRVATTTNLGSTYDTTAKTLTMSANGALSVDGATLSANDRVLVKDQTTGSQNGIYSVTSTGDASSPAVLTRAEDADSHGEFENATTFVQEGSTNADIGYTQTTDAFTMDSSNAVWAQFSSAGSFSGGDGIDISGKVVSADTDNTSVEIQSGKIAVKAGGVSSGHLAADCIDNSKIADSAVQDENIANKAVSTAKLNDSAVTNAKLGADCVDGNKIADNAVNTEHITNASVTSDKMSSGAVATATLQDNCVTSGKIAAGAVGASDIANSAVGSVHIGASAVGTAAINDSAVNGDKLANGSVTDAKFGTINTFTATGTITANTFAASSDCTLKDNIEPMENCLDEVCKWNPVSYNFKDDENKMKRTGLIAQEVQEHAEHLVKYNDDKEHLTVNYIDTIAYLIGAIKELKERLD